VDLDLAASVQVDRCPIGLSVLVAIVELDVPLCVNLSPPDPSCLVGGHVHEDHRLLGSHLEHAVLNEHLTAEEEMLILPRSPGVDLIGGQLNRLGITRDIPAEAKHVVRRWFDRPYSLGVQPGKRQDQRREQEQAQNEQAIALG
jgi:hypothetical protein